MRRSEWYHGGKLVALAIWRVVPSMPSLVAPSGTSLLATRSTRNTKIARKSHVHEIVPILHSPDVVYAFSEAAVGERFNRQSPAFYELLVIRTSDLPDLMVPTGK